MFEVISAGVFVVGIGIYLWIHTRPEPLRLMKPLPVHLRECPHCAKEVHIWRKYADGRISCVECSR